MCQVPGEMNCSYFVNEGEGHGGTVMSKPNMRFQESFGVIVASKDLRDFNSDLVFVENSQERCRQSCWVKDKIIEEKRENSFKV